MTKAAKSLTLTGMSEDNKNKVIFRFPILHIGWDMDNEGWVEQDEHGQHKVFTTNHGKTVEMTKDDLITKSLEALHSAWDIRNAIRFLDNN